MNTDTAKNRDAEQAAASESALPVILAATKATHSQETAEHVRSFLAYIQEATQPDFGLFRNALFHAPQALPGMWETEPSDLPLSTALLRVGYHRYYATQYGLNLNTIVGFQHRSGPPGLFDAAKAFAAGMQSAERAAAERGDELDGTTKQSVSMPKRTWEAIKFLADAEGISRSAWIARAADQAATRAAERTRALAVTAEFIEEFEAEHGPISEADYAEADAILDAITRTNS